MREEGFAGLWVVNALIVEETIDILADVINKRK
jgi:hypothetical protein